MTPHRAPKTRCRRVKPRKRLSQCFLSSPAITRFISGVVPLKGKRVLEIGAGTGTLTKALAEKAGFVLAIEVDERLLPELRQNLSGFDDVEIVCGNALKADFSGFKTVFGNLPYHLSSPFLFKILESGFMEAVLMLQKEFAERLTARPGSKDWSRLAVMTQSVADVEVVGFVPRTEFTPVPRVDSAIVLLRANRKHDLNPLLVNALFQHKNQSVKNSLLHSAKFLNKTKKEILSFLDSLEPQNLKDKKVRTLELKELADLSFCYADFTK